MADIVIFDAYIPFSAGGDLTLIFTATHGYNGFSGNSPWQLWIDVDDARVNSTGGAGAITDSVSLSAAAKNLAAGNHHVVVKWYGQSNMTLNGKVLTCLITYR